MRPCIGLSLTIVATAGLLSGCGASGEGAADRPERFPASGVVLYEQQPVEGAMVVFAPQDHTHPASAKTGPDGRFELRTYEPGDGAVPGDFKVTVTKIEVISQGTPATDDEEVPDPVQKWLLPHNYGKADTSGLTATVTDIPEANVFTFELEGPITGGKPQTGRTRVPSQE